LATKIRLTRLGGHTRPYYRFVVTDRRSARDGRSLDSLGFYDPLATGGRVKIDAGKLKQWLAKGAQPSVTVKQLIRKMPAAV
jgi:small subunit ribosomal protein S16